MSVSNEKMKAFAAEVARVARQGAVEFLTVSGSKADPDKLTQYLKEEVSKAFEGAVNAYKEAKAVNMGKVGLITFTLTIKQAGIDAAKRACE